jgi:hypothetical protein
MKRTRPAFRELRRVFSGYLHEDFALEHSTPGEALRAFAEDASPAEVRRFRAEAKRFLADTETLELRELRRRLAELGCRWNPPSRAALVALLSVDDGARRGG